MKLSIQTTKQSESANMQSTHVNNPNVVVVAPGSVPVFPEPIEDAVAVDVTEQQEPAADGAITAHPYTTKKGKAAMYLAGFTDMKDPRYAPLAEHNVKPCYIRNEDGSRTYVAYFGARYGEGARLFAEALTTGNAETLAKAHEAMKQAHPYYGKEAA